MRHLFFEPHPVLKPYIKGYFDIECFKETTFFFKPIPDIYFEIGLFYSGGFIQENNSEKHYYKSYIGGLPMESNYKCTHQGIPCCVSIYFQPGGFYNLFGIPSGEISDPVNFELVTGNSGREFFEKVQYAKTPEERIRIVDSYFLKHYKERSKSTDTYYSRIAGFIHNKNGCITIQDLCKECNITKRKLDRNFKRNVGTGPKEFARIVRFNRIFEMFHKTRKTDIHDIVFGCGFYDQSHLINEFKDFVKCSPGKFFKNENKYLLSVYRKFLFC